MATNRARGPRNSLERQLARSFSPLPGRLQIRYDSLSLKWAWLKVPKPRIQSALHRLGLHPDRMGCRCLHPDRMYLGGIQKSVRAIIPFQERVVCGGFPSLMAFLNGLKNGNDPNHLTNPGMI